MDATATLDADLITDGQKHELLGMLVNEMNRAPHIPSGSTVSPEAPSFEELLELREFGATRPSQSGLTPSEFIKTMDPQAREEAAAKFAALHLS